VIRATETVSLLETRLEAAERDRDDIRLQLEELLEQQRRHEDTEQRCELCQQRDGPTGTERARASCGVSVYSPAVRSVPNHSPLPGDRGT